MDRDIYFMKQAFKEAQKAALIDEVPIGCVVVYQDKIIARGHNKRESKQDPLGHAEMIAIKKASQKLGSWRLVDTTIYITLEPCPMCAGAILNSRIPTIVYGASDPKGGALGSSFNLFDQPNLNHHPIIKSGILAKECSQLLQDFFRAKRR